jgi:hemerythrin-like domain-containing protein
MCSYCGCEAEPVVEALMADHGWIASRVRAIEQALETERTDDVGWLVAGLAEAFAHHAQLEESGLFAQLREAGEAVEEVDRLIEEHRRLIAGLSAQPAAEPARLRGLLADLIRHAEIEDTDLFPFAMQMLPNECWGLVEEVHQQLLAV